MKEGEPICRECFTVLDSKFFEEYFQTIDVFLSGE